MLKYSISWVVYNYYCRRCPRRDNGETEVDDEKSEDEVGVTGGTTRRCGTRRVRSLENVTDQSDRSYGCLQVYRLRR